MKFEKEFLEQISFPLGGLGTGCIGLAGNGRLIDWEIFNQPNKGSINGFSHFAIKAKTKNGVITRALVGDMTHELMGQFQKANFAPYGYGFGPQTETMASFPHFANVTFDGSFPFARLSFQDETFPGLIRMTAFNPFIPLDSDNSGIPAAFFEFEVKNESSEPIEFQLAFSVSNPFPFSQNKTAQKDGITMITLSDAKAQESDLSFGDLSVATDHPDVLWQTYWYRGVKRDGIITFWKNFSSEEDLKDRVYTTPGCFDAAWKRTPAGTSALDTCTLVAKIPTQVNETKKVRFVLSWNVPNQSNYWVAESFRTHWRNYYATVFENSTASATYAINHWDSLMQRTLAFERALKETTMDETILETVQNTISILKSPTVLRLEDGSFYGWEGVQERKGSCEGTCTHVWNYAYALPFLFPALERSIRTLEFTHSVKEDGYMVFRLKLPLGVDRNVQPPACDGQMGTIVRAYREWKISGDDAWLAKFWPTIKKVLEFAWAESNPFEWDRNKDGVLEGRQHHTLDQELFGPSGWLESMYLAALSAAIEMATFMNEPEKVKEYSALFENGYAYMRDHLFNGKYFIQEIDLKDKSILEHFQCVENFWHREAEEIKFQIKDGSSIEQMLGQWHAMLNGLPAVVDREQMCTALENMMKNNFKPSFRFFPNLWRAFSVNDEAGSIVCAFPDDVETPMIPAQFADMNMHGMEYMFACLLFSAGKMEDGLRVVKAVRDNYDGKKRNPYNEMECGSNYARSMAGYALLLTLGGFDFHLSKKYIGFHPLVNQDHFKSFFSLGTGWGTFGIDQDVAFVNITEGSLTLNALKLPFVKSVSSVVIDETPCDFTFQDGVVSFRENCIRSSVRVTFEHA